MRRMPFLVGHFVPWYGSYLRQPRWISWVWDVRAAYLVLWILNWFGDSEIRILWVGVSNPHLPGAYVFGHNIHQATLKYLIMATLVIYDHFNFIWAPSEFMKLNIILRWSLGVNRVPDSKLPVPGQVLYLIGILGWCGLLNQIVLGKCPEAFLAGDFIYLKKE